MLVCKSEDALGARIHESVDGMAEPGYLAARFVDAASQFEGLLVGFEQASALA